MEEAEEIRVKKDMDLFESAIMKLKKSFQESNEGIERFYSDMYKLGKSITLQGKEYIRLKDIVDRNVAETKDNSLLNKWKELEEKLDKLKVPLKSLEKETNTSHDRFVMGKISVKAWSNEEKEQMKDQYNKFKFRTSILFILFPLFQLLYGVDNLLRLFFNFLRHPDTKNSLHIHWIVYIYLSLALRENVLRVNGSKINPWWIYHHYIGALAAFLSVTISSNSIDSDLYTLVLTLMVSQGVIMLLQNQYQSRRHYAMVAIGKKNSIDVAHTETPERWSVLFLLVPILYFTYIFEVFVGGMSIYYSLEPKGFSPAIFVIGILFILMGLGNSFTVFVVLLQKKEMNAKKRVDIAKTKFNQSPSPIKISKK